MPGRSTFWTDKRLNDLAILWGLGVRQRWIGRILRCHGVTAQAKASKMGYRRPARKIDWQHMAMVHGMITYAKFMSRRDVGKLMGESHHRVSYWLGKFSKEPRAKPPSTKKPKTNTDRKRRLCLMCTKKFSSRWAGERICKPCKGSPAWRGSSSAQYSVLS